VLSRIDRAAAAPALKRGAAHLCCWTGKMGRQDRLDLLLTVTDRLVHQLGRTDLHLAVLGDGECLGEMKTEVARLGLEPWVTFTGWVSEEEVFRYLATSDVGLDASLQIEVSPVKVMEYMGAGLPVVAFDLPETRTVAEGAAVLVAPGDVDALAGAVDALLDEWRAAGATVLVATHADERLAARVDGWLRLVDGLLVEVGGRGASGDVMAVTALQPWSGALPEGSHP